MARDCAICGNLKLALRPATCARGRQLTLPREVAVWLLLLVLPGSGRRTARSRRIATCALRLACRGLQTCRDAVVKAQNSSCRDGS